MTDTELIANVNSWRERLNEASGRYGGVEICAVTKTVAPERINAVWEAGIRVLGENRVQEMLEKWDKLDPRFEMDIIGRLQTNKVKYLPGKAARVQSLDRLDLARELSRRAVQEKICFRALVQVNIAREEQKAGVCEEELIPLLRGCAELPGLKIEGLMAIMPKTDDPEQARPYFRKMRVLFERLRDNPVPGAEMRELSMGMSADCLVAAQEGATLVRLGQALFGAR